MRFLQLSNLHFTMPTLISTSLGVGDCVVEFGLSFSFCAFFASLFTAHWYSGTTPTKQQSMNKPVLKIVSKINFNSLTLRTHSNCEALLKSALLTFSSHVHINFTIIAILALVDCVFCDASSKESCIMDEIIR